ncbi:MAG: class I SAM-dependent methyltransferase [Actinomycetota bacterium]|nr:class I SAM-dependent methyltransferase [Actinomycetota bacterium]MDQ2958578.1 class I SAM-dependent methyltransferase [Actinomycetota bacterium]
MPTFASKPTPGEAKLRGGYYTPEPIGRFVAGWVAEAGRRLLEPSCGDGAILQHLVAAAGRRSVTAIELFPAEAAKAGTSIGVTVVCADFFSWFTADRHGSFDGVAGNPPYIRFGSWDEPSRTLALDLLRAEGLRPTKLTNAWLPFVVASVLAVRPGGRVGLVLPAELLQVGYAAALRSYLVDSCSQITVVSFAQLVFPGILQEVVLLLAERGEGPAGIRTVEVRDAAALDQLDLAGAPAVRAHLHESEKWTKYYLGIEAIEALRTVRTDGRLLPLSHYAEVDVGVVTGRNSFFCMSAVEAKRRGLSRLTMPLVARSYQVPGLVFTAEDLAALDETDAATRLLVLPESLESSRNTKLLSYLAEGAADGVPDGHKCRIRRSWWRVPSIWVPDGFMLRQISTHPRLTDNRTGATSTDTVHRVRVQPGVAMDRLATGAYNSATFALAEVLGRSYGGGILELEPTECEHLPVPDPALVPAALVQKVDELVRAGRPTDALDLVDQAILVEKLGFSTIEVLALRTAWMQLRDRRTRRSKRSTT